MDTKSKSWTALTAVKIIFFVLILAMCFLIMNRGFTIDRTYSSTGVSPEIVLAVLPGEAEGFEPDKFSSYYQHNRFKNYTTDRFGYFDDSTIWITLTAIQTDYTRDMIIITAAAVMIIISFIILMLGAGRRYKRSDFINDDEGDVSFSVIDKPYLDISLAAVFFYTYCMIYLAANVGWSIWHYRNVVALNVVYAAVSVLIAPPVLLWLMSFAKRAKAGKFWKYTLIYALPNWLIHLCLRTAKTLWAGTTLVLKAIIISIAAFLMMFMTGLMGPSIPMLIAAILFTIVVAFLILRYAARLRKLEQGARDVAGGTYGVQINAGGGELGSIASSVTNISAGINAAVEQRMKSERFKTELITNVSHDIRTPLTSIITYTDLLKSEGLDNEKAPEYLDVLINKSQRLKTLTDELFEAAKAASGNIDVSITELDIVSLINQVLGELDNSIKSSGLDIRVNLPERLMVKADGRLMWRVLENLFSNILKYSLTGSRVYIDAEPAGSEYVRVDLKNISAAELKINPADLTERFKRGDESRADGGSGLGLSIAQSFMAAQKGSLALTADGDLFKAAVYLPVVK